MIRPMQIALLLLICTAGVLAHAMKIPILMNHQSLLTDSDGVPLNGNFDLTYRIYDSPLGGMLLWQETHPAVPVSNGLVNVVLGSIDPLTPETFADSSDTGTVLVRYLEMQVGSDAPLSPMTQLVSAPYAVTAYRLAGDLVTGRSYLGVKVDPLGDLPDNEVPERDVPSAVILGSNAFRSALEIDYTKPPDDSVPAITLEANAVGNTISIWSTDSIPVIQARTDASEYALGIKPFDLSLNHGDILAWSMTSNGFHNALELNWPQSPEDSVPDITMEAKDSANSINVLSPGSNPAIQFGADWINNEFNMDFHGEVLNVVEGSRWSAANLSTDAFRTALEMNWPQTPTDSVPAVRIEANDSTHELAIYPSGVDDIGPAIRLAASSTASRLDLKLNDGDGSSDPPQILALSTATACSLRVGWEAPPSDTKPGFNVMTNATQGTVELRGVSAGAGAPPAIEMLANDTEARIGINLAGAPQSALDVVGNICVTGTVESCSDEKFKKNIHTIDHALEKLSHVRGVGFEWRQDEYSQMRFAEGRQIGVIAQDVESVLPEIVHSPNGSYKTVDYAKLTAVLVEAVKELRSENDALKRRVAKLESR